MGAIKEYRIDIVERTLEILKKFYPEFEENEREVTFLMNCLLGLIIAISESENQNRNLLRGNITEDFIENIPDTIGFVHTININEDLTNQDLTNINVKVGHKSDLLGKDKFWLISKIRNCIGHQNIKGINKEGKWIGVRLWNIINSRKDFEIVFTIDEIKTFAIDLAERFIRQSR
ncbi:MAG: hypothetical protein IH950_03025 [Bacteroidetes bacterium]|nr:hypothetical protein [Bacteroidota bacterium]